MYINTLAYICNVLTYINLTGGNENFEWRSETVAADERRLFVFPFLPVSGETALGFFS